MHSHWACFAFRSSYNRLLPSINQRVVLKADYVTLPVLNRQAWRGQIICEPESDVTLQSACCTSSAANQDKRDRCRRVATSEPVIGSTACKTQALYPHRSTVRDRAAYDLPQYIGTKANFLQKIIE